MRRLLIRPGAIGDCILAFPAMEYLKAAYTEVWISRPVVPLVHFADTVRPLSATGIDLAGIGNPEADENLKARLAAFDSVVSWYGTNRPEFRLVLQAAGVRCEFHPALPPDSFDGHACDFFARQVGAPCGLAPSIRLPTSERRNCVVIHPFSGSQQKNWPLDRYHQLATKIEIGVDWVTGPEQHLDGSSHFDALDDLGAWMSGSRLYIGNDSGITHLAAAIGIPVLALFGPTSPDKWSPRGNAVEVVHCDLLADLPVTKVLNAANRLLGSQ